GITYPEVYEMQARAIFEAAAKCAAGKVEVHPEVMIPLVGTVREFVDLAGRIRAVGEAVAAKTKIRVPYLVGTMIEVPRACLVAGADAEEGELFPFVAHELAAVND